MLSQKHLFYKIPILIVFVAACSSPDKNYRQLTCEDIYLIEDTVDRSDLFHFGYQQLKGIQIPDAKLISLDGTTTAIHSLDKDAYLLDFWFIGCAPCEAEMPFLTELEHSLENVGFISIARNDPEDLKAYFHDRTDFEDLYLADSIYSKLCVSGYPTKFILNADFVIQNMFTGGSLDPDRIQAHMDDLQSQLEMAMGN